MHTPRCYLRDICPSPNVALTIIVANRPDSHHRPVRLQTHGVRTSSRNLNDICPPVYIALTVIGWRAWLIRPSGEQRLSNFMLWHAAYAELYFTDVLWPDFGEEDLNRAFEAYRNRERRFGLTGEQIRSVEQVHE